MKLKIASCVAVPCLVIAIGLAVTADGQTRSGTITLHAKAQLDQAHLVDNPPSGGSAGDLLIFTEKLLNRGGAVIGHDAATCTSLFDQRSLCTGIYVLPGGQLMVQLQQPGLTGTLTYNQAITGGTGRYARASGTVKVDQKPTGDHFTFLIHTR